VTEISQMAEASRAPSIVRRPRDAATLVIVDRTDAAPRVLMGRRRPDQVFLPDTFVFPGGRVEPVDRALARSYALAPSASEHVKLAMRGRPSDTRASALALAAIRETYEETGVIVGEAHPHGGGADQGAWTGFLAQGYRPRLDSLAFFARGPAAALRHAFLHRRCNPHRPSRARRRRRAPGHRLVYAGASKRPEAAVHHAPCAG